MTLVGEVLQGVLRQRGTTQSELAAAMGVSSGAVNHIITGRRKAIDLDLSWRLSQALATPDAFWKEIYEDEVSNNARSVDYYIAKSNEIEATASANCGVLVDFQIRQLAAQQVDTVRTIDELGDVIEGFDERRLQGSSYDTVLGGYWEIRGGMSQPRDVNGELRVEASSSLKVYTHEFFRMPSDVHARIAPAGRFLQNGVMVAHGPLIDPLFEGRLTVTLHNFYNEPIKINTASPFLTIVFEKLAATPHSRRRLLVDSGGDVQYEDNLSKREQELLEELDKLRAERGQKYT